MPSLWRALPTAPSPEDQRIGVAQEGRDRTADRIDCPEVRHPDWATPAAVKAQFRTASILKDGRVVFSLAGNKDRLVVWINYPYRVVYVRFIGSHEQYDAIDAQTI